MIRISTHDHPVQTFIISPQALDIRILLRYSDFLKEWFISLSLVQDEENTIVSSRKLVPNRFVMDHRGLIFGLNWDVYCSGKYATGPFDINAFTENNYNLFYATIQEKFYIDFLERVTGYNKLREQPEQ